MYPQGHEGQFVLDALNLEGQVRIKHIRTADQRDHPCRMLGKLLSII